MKLFWQYIKSNIKTVLVFLLFSAVFTILFILYKLPIAAVLYAVAICSFFGLIILIFDYRSFMKKHKTLNHLMDEIKVTTEHLPATYGVLEADYQNIIKTLYEEKLLLADEMERRYTDMTDYYTVWAHQIKTPISSMKLTLQEDHSTEGRELFEDLQRIEQYVDMVLCYLRLDADSTDYVIKEYDLDDIVKQAVRKFASQFIRRKIKLEYEPMKCIVLTDEKWLLFVIEQILSNALKYTKSGTISITLEEGKVLCISDTGIGIEPEDLPRIFEKGYTGYNGRSDKKASGIGLYLCRRICDNLRHTINAISTIDNGTIIRIGLARDRLEIE